MGSKNAALFLICVFIASTFGKNVMEAVGGSTNGPATTRKPFVRVFVNCSECYDGAMYHIKCRHGCNRFITLPVSYSPTKFKTAGTDVPWLKAKKSVSGNSKTYVNAPVAVPGKRAKAIVTLKKTAVAWKKVKVNPQGDNQILAQGTNSDNKVNCLECFGKKGKGLAKCMAGCNKHIPVSTVATKVITAGSAVPWVKLPQVNKNGFGYLMQSDKQNEQDVDHSTMNQDVPSKDSIIKFIDNNNNDAILILLASVVACLLILIFVISVGLCCYWKRSKQAVKKRIKEPNAYVLKPLEFRAV